MTFAIWLLATEPKTVKQFSARKHARSIYGLIHFFYFSAANKALFRVHSIRDSSYTCFQVVDKAFGFTLRFRLRQYCDCKLWQLHSALRLSAVLLCSPTIGALFSCNIWMRLHLELREASPHVPDLWCGIYCIISTVTLVLSFDMKILLISCSFLPALRAGLPASFSRDCIQTRVPYK